MLIIHYTLFYKHDTGKVVILVVYVDDIVITGNDLAEISSLKKYLAREFERFGEIEIFSWN